MVMSRLRVAVALIALVIYLALPTKNYYWDGISFAQTIEDAQRWPALLHPNHLVYNVIGHALYRALGARVRAFYVLQTMNAVFAAVTVYLMFGILQETTKSEGATLCLAGLFAFSGTWWRFATDANAYILSVCFLTGCASLLVTSQRTSPISVAVLHTCAMLVHQLAVLFFPAALFALWCQRPEERQRRRMGRILVYAALAGTLTLATYIAAFVAQNASVNPRAFLVWTASHATEVALSFHPLNSVAATVQSWARLFVAGRASLVHYSQPTTIVLLALLGSALILLSVATARRGFRQRIRIHHPFLFYFALAWFAAYFTFLLFWLPRNTFYKLFALPAVILLIASCWAPGRDPRMRGPAVPMVTAVAIFNFTFAIIPYSRVTANPALDFALRLNPVLQSGAVVYYYEFNSDDWFVRYFNPQTIWQQAVGPSQIDDDLRAGKLVWLDTTAIDRFTGTEPAWLAQRTAGKEWHELVNLKHRIRFVRLRLADTH